MNEREYRLKSEKLSLVKDLGGKIIKWSAICFIAWRASLVVEALAGKQTLAEFGVFLLADLKANKVISHAVSVIFGASGIAYGYRSRKLRQKDIQRLGTRVVDLEQKIDPERSSSGLTNKGTNRSEDLT
jgi:p-aminobenzoyl-glutamate transporter AbgT